MTADGVLAGRIAHIEAALPDGPRFRSSMTNEERRNFENLLLLCGTHHDIVDADVTTWTVERLHQLKKSHEEIYTGAVDLLRSTVGDITEGTAWRPSTNLKKILDPACLTSEEIAGNLQAINSFAERLAAIPRATRSVLAVIVTRGDPASGSWEEVTIPIPVLEQVVDCSPGELVDHIDVLDHFKLAYIETEPYEGPFRANVGNSAPGIGWPILADLKEMSGGDPTVIRQVLVDLDFTAFDE